MDCSYWTSALMAVTAIVRTIAVHRLSVQNLEGEQQRRDPQVSRRRRRRYSVHPLWRNRETEGDLVLITQMLTDMEDKFYGYFHMSRNCFEDLLARIGPQLVREVTRMKKPIEPKERLAVCLRYLVTGDSLKTISYNFRMGHSTVHKIVTETCRIITSTLLPETISTPSVERWESIRQQFWEKCRFPNCLGAIDGKHVTIQAPGHTGSMYYNNKKTFSIVLLAVADADANFIAIEVGAFGQNSDEGIFAKSRLGQQMISGTYPMLPDSNLPGTSVSVPCVFVGDEAFPLMKNLLTPYPDSRAEEDAKMTQFNHKLSMARGVVENAFGILTRMFRIYNHRIQNKPENAEHIITSTCALYNFIRAHEAAGGMERATETDPTTQGGDMMRSLSHHRSNATKEAVDVRDKFKNFLQTPNM